MQSKTTSAGNVSQGSSAGQSGPPVRSGTPWAGGLLPLAAALLLGGGSWLVAAASPAPARASVAEHRVDPGGSDPNLIRAADADRDVGPGSAESILAQHPPAAAR